MSARRARRIGALAVAALLPAAAAAALMADNEPRSVVVNGDFEDGTVSLRLPAVSPFPLVAGGWGGRADAGDAIVTVTEAGSRSLQVASAPGAPAHVVQDVPVGMRSFVLELSARRLRGRQTLRLFSSWDRMDPESGEGVSLQLAAGGVRISTPRGSWWVDAPMTGGGWIAIRLASDARTGLVQLWLNERLVASVPGAPAVPRTLVLGGNALRGRSVFGYDDVRMFRLADLELAELRRAVLAHADDRDRPWVLERLDAAASALERGSGVLATPEIRAALRLLERSPGLQADPQVTLAASALLELVAAS